MKDLFSGHVHVFVDDAGNQQVSVFEDGASQARDIDVNSLGFFAKKALNQLVDGLKK